MYPKTTVIKINYKKEKRNVLAYSMDLDMKE
jgi:hypothetical protein